MPTPAPASRSSSCVRAVPSTGENWPGRKTRIISGRSSAGLPVLLRPSAACRAARTCRFSTPERRHRFRASSQSSVDSIFFFGFAFQIAQNDRTYGWGGGIRPGTYQILTLTHTRPFFNADMHEGCCDPRAFRNQASQSLAKKKQRIAIDFYSRLVVRTITSPFCMSNMHC